MKHETHLFFFFGHNKAAVSVVTLAVSELKSGPTVLCCHWLIICQRGKQELLSRVGVLQERLGGWKGKAALERTLLRWNSGFGYVAQNAHMSLYSANAVFRLTGFTQRKKKHNNNIKRKHKGSSKNQISQNVSFLVAKMNKPSPHVIFRDT